MRLRLLLTNANTELFNIRRKDESESECGASPWMGDADYGMYGECKEHCEFSIPKKNK